MRHSRHLLVVAVLLVACPAWCQAGVVKIYWAWNNGGSDGGVERVDADGSNRELLTAKTNYPAGIDVDPSTGKVYYTLAGNREIRSCDLDGGDNERVLTGPTSYVRGIDLDVLGGKMYWIAGNYSGSAKQVLRANLSGSATQYLHESVDGTNELTDLSLDLTNGRVYWTDYGTRVSTPGGSATDGAIGYGSLDGSGTAVVTGVGGDPRGVVVDPIGGKVYWADYANNGSGAIYQANLDLTDVTTLITGRTGPAGITLDVAAGKIYWSDSGSNGSIYRADMANGGNLETLVTNIGARASDIALVFDNIPAGWTAQDVGSPTKAGFAVHHEATGRFVVESAATGVLGTNDEFHYVHGSHDTGTADFTAMARLWSQENTDGSAVAGLMARDGVATDAAFVMTAGTPGNGIQLQSRDNGSVETTDSLAGSPNTAKDGAAPVWLMLRRRGDTFHSYYAPDKNGQPGVWSGETTQDVALPADVRLGLAVASNSATTYGTGVFDNVKIGNWEPRAELQMTQDGKFIGSAHALDDLNGDGTLGNDEVMDVQWKIECLSPEPGLMSQWFLGKSTADWTGSPDYRLVAPNVDRNSGQYPQEVIDGEGLTGGLDFFAVKYNGQIYVDQAGTVAFKERVDDYARLYIDGELLITDNVWNYDRTATISLTEGWHDIEFRTWDGWAGDMAHLDWDPAGGTDWVPVPAEVLRYSLIAEGTGAIGDPLSMDFFDGAVPPKGAMYRLTVNYLGEEISVVTYAPEPASWLLLCMGVVLLSLRRRRVRA